MKVGKKRRLTRSAYSNNNPEDRAKIGMDATKTCPARATRHFAVHKTTARRLTIGTTVTIM